MADAGGHVDSACCGDTAAGLAHKLRVDAGDDAAGAHTGAAGAHALEVGHNHHTRDKLADVAQRNGVDAAKRIAQPGIVVDKGYSLGPVVCV